MRAPPTYSPCAGGGVLWDATHTGKGLNTTETDETDEINGQRKGKERKNQRKTKERNGHTKNGPDNRNTFAALENVRAFAFACVVSWIARPLWK